MIPRADFPQVGEFWHNRDLPAGGFVTQMPRVP